MREYPLGRRAEEHFPHGRVSEGAHDEQLGARTQHQVADDLGWTRTDGDLDVRRHAVVVQTSILERRTFLWLIHKVLYKVFGSMAMVNMLLKRHQIDLLSHVWTPFLGRRPVKVISWIPDFQYLHLPELAPSEEILDGYRADKDWQHYVEQFEALMDERNIPGALNRAQFASAACCLLCSEATPEQCHRRLVAERIQARWPQVEIIHL